MCFQVFVFLAFRFWRCVFCDFERRPMGEYFPYCLFFPSKHIHWCEFLINGGNLCVFRYLLNCFLPRIRTAEELAHECQKWSSLRTRIQFGKCKVLDRLLYHEKVTVKSNIRRVSHLRSMAMRFWTFYEPFSHSKWSNDERSLSCDGIEQTTGVFVTSLKPHLPHLTRWVSKVDFGACSTGM